MKVFKNNCLVAFRSSMVAEDCHSFFVLSKLNVKQNENNIKIKDKYIKM